MNRLGFGVDSLRPAYNALRMHPQVRNVTLMTHFADADGAGGIKAQLDWFNELTQPFEAQQPLARQFRGAARAFPEARGDWVRPASCSTAARRSRTAAPSSSGLKPAMTLSSEIIAIQHLQPGERVGYGFSYEAVGEMTHRHRRLRLRRRLSAPRVDRHAGAGQRKARAHRWTRIDGHDQRRHLRHARGPHRHAGHALGRGALGRRGRAPRPAR